MATTETTLPGAGIHHGWTAGESGWQVGMETNLHLINALLTGKVLDVVVPAPASPTSGDSYIVGPSGTGAFAGKDKNLAFYYEGAWFFFTPGAGYLVWNVAAADYWFYNGTVWALYDPSGSGISDAPLDGTIYGRKDGAWIDVPIGIADSPVDGQEYVRKDGAWAVNTGGAGGIPEAPNDGGLYGRQSLGWVDIGAAGNATYFGSGDPSGLHNDGDFYFDTDKTPYAPWVQNSGAWSRLNNYDLSLNFTGTPDVSKTMWRFTAVRDFVLPVSLTGSHFFAETAPSATTVLTISKNGSSVGTLSFAGAGNIPTVTFASAQTFTSATPDVLTVTSPSNLNGLADISGTLAGHR